MPAARLTPDDNEARSDWWISSRAYFDGFIGQVERVPFDLSRQNMYEIPSDIYREFDEQKREIERNKKENKEPTIADQHYGLSDFTQFQSTQYWQPDTSSQPGSYYSFGRVPFHMGRKNLQTTIETHDDVDGIFYQNIPNRGRREQFPSKYKLTSFMEQPPTTILPKERVNKTKNKGKKANLSPLNLGGAFEDGNVEENNVTYGEEYHRFLNNGISFDLGQNDFHSNDSLHLQNGPHFSNPESSFDFRSNEYNTDDVVNENPQNKIHKWQKFMSFEPDIPETTVYKAKPNILEQYSQQSEIEKG
ncbi:hypothetical protein Tco_1441314 [Tanacetum coccineum]